MKSWLTFKAITKSSRVAIFGLLAIFVVGCSASFSHNDRELDTEMTIYIMPFSNQSNMPMAQAQVEELVASVLAAEGLNVQLYPKQRVNDIQASLDPERRYTAAQSWLAQQPAGYVLNGSVHEWQYKYGLDGEPAVGLTLTISNMSQQVLWRNSSSRSGWGRESLTQMGLKTISDMVNTLSW